MVTRDLTFERLNLVRIALGLVLLHRYGSNAVALWLLPSSDLQLATVAWQLVCATLLTAGLVTPLAALALFLFQQPADRVLLSWSLGSMVLQMVLLPMALLPAGTRYALDVRLKDVAAIRALYSLWGTPTVARASALRLLSFVAFGAVSLSAVQFHLADPLWSTGLSQAYVFTNPYFSPYAAGVTAAIEEWPRLALLASQVSTAAMLFWEAFMVPVALTTRLGRRYVVLHGLIFFALSAMLLNLAWLPYFELTLWALVFWVGPDLRISGAALRHDWRLAAMVTLYAVGLTGAVLAFPWVHVTNPVPLVTERLGSLNTDVFNYVDLRTNESYATVSRLGADGGETPLPFNAADGRRLGWHFSERTYYGISLPWRRVRIGRADECWTDDLDRPWADQVVALDRGLGAPPGASYAMVFYVDPLPAATPGTLTGRRAEARRLCRVVYDPRTSEAIARP